MTPTICEDHNSNTLRDARSKESSVINFVGKITHRRHIRRSISRLSFTSNSSSSTDFNENSNSGSESNKDIMMNRRSPVSIASDWSSYQDESSSCFSSTNRRLSNSSLESENNFHNKFNSTSISSTDNKQVGLMDIAIKTVKLMKRNQILQQKLSQLQFETQAFIQSVLDNPENQAIKEQFGKTAVSET